MIVGAAMVQFAVFALACNQTDWRKFSGRKTLHAGAGMEKLRLNRYLSDAVF